MDIISFNEAATANGRIEKFIENPDSNSGVLTQPKVIEAGETVTIKSGRQAILADTVVDGDLIIEAGADVFIPAGSSVDFSNGIKVNGEKLTMSIPTAYHIYNGSVEATNTEITNGFSTTLYTGNGSAQSINTGIDMDTQWGDTAEEKFGGLVWLKGRSLASSNNLADTVRGATKMIYTDLTSTEFINTANLNAFNNNGFSIGNSGVNTSAATYASWNFQTTHRRTGVTNHGKAYTEHYNPFTGFTIIKYEGSGIAGHEIPHSLGRKLGFRVIKNLSLSTMNWAAEFDSNGFLELNTTNAFHTTLKNDTTYNRYVINNNVANWNASTNQYIMYGWANSYLDEDNTLIGNYEVGVYQGTGVVQKIKTSGKPAWLMIKRLDSTGDWIIFDNQRLHNALYPNLSIVEYPSAIGFEIDGVKLTSTLGGKYLYMVVYDNDSGSGKSKYPKATDTTNLSINALVPYANGIDINGSKVSIEYKNETITGLTLTEGKNYLYSKNDGTYSVSTIAPSYGIENPLTGDFFNLKTLKWYDNTNDEITPRTYLDCVVYAGHNGQVTYVEELPKIEYKDIIKANEYQGKNACTAWAIIDGQTTPPTIIDSYGISSVIKTTTGKYELIPTEDFNNEFFSVTGTSGISTAEFKHLEVQTKNRIKVQIWSGSSYVDAIFSVQIFGGKN